VTIETLDLHAPGVAEELLRVHLAGYEEEARLLGADDFPPLRRTIGDLRAAASRFLGCFDGGRLVGYVELEDLGEELLIASLVVDPAAFRRGVGTALVRRAIETAWERPVAVGTGVDNAPARELYAKLGFVERERRTVAGGIRVVRLVRLGASPRP
jgi:ribosomal protein S18 acetylase RimI-like enzyme